MVMKEKQSIRAKEPCIEIAWTAAGSCSSDSEGIRRCFYWLLQRAVGCDTGGMRHCFYGLLQRAVGCDTGGKRRCFNGLLQGVAVQWHCRHETLFIRAAAGSCSTVALQACDAVYTGCCRVLQYSGTAGMRRCLYGCCRELQYSDTEGMRCCLYGLLQKAVECDTGGMRHCFYGFLQRAVGCDTGGKRRCLYWLLQGVAVEWRCRHETLFIRAAAGSCSKVTLKA